MENVIIKHGSDQLNRRYAVVAKDGTVENIVMWDGITPFDPGVGLELHPLADDSVASPGDVVDRKTLAVIEKAEQPQQEPTLEERVAALEAKDNA